jgi:hypothetical protein
VDDTPAAIGPATFGFVGHAPDATTGRHRTALSSIRELGSPRSWGWRPVPTADVRWLWASRLTAFARYAEADPPPPFAAAARDSVGLGPPARPTGGRKDASQGSPETVIRVQERGPAPTPGCRCRPRRPRANVRRLGRTDKPGTFPGDRARETRLASPSRFRRQDWHRHHPQRRRGRRRDAFYVANAWARASPTGCCCRPVSPRSS